MINAQDQQFIVNLIQSLVTVVYKYAGTPVSSPYALPFKAGDMYINTLSGAVYISTDAGSGAVWVQII